MKILVTGGFGFIGRHLVKRLLEAGHEVTVCDSMQGPNSRVISDARIKFFHSRFQNVLPEIVKGQDLVIHLAAQTSVVFSTKSPLLDASDNILGTLGLIEHANWAAVPHFIFASSGGAVYGESAHEQAHESHPTEPVSPYGVSKLAAERYLIALRGALENFYASMTILRLGNVYGPGQMGGEGAVIPTFITAIGEKRKPVIYGTGMQVRDFVHVSDVVAAFDAVVRRIDDAEVYGTFNVGTGAGATIRYLCTMISRLLNWEGGYEFAPARNGEVNRSVLNVQRAHDRLGWIPSIPLELGVERLIKDPEVAFS